MSDIENELSVSHPDESDLFYIILMSVLSNGY
jgi:hypothetical protein